MQEGGRRDAVDGRSGQPHILGNCVHMMSKSLYSCAVGCLDALCYAIVPTGRRSISRIGFRRAFYEGSLNIDLLSGRRADFKAFAFGIRPTCGPEARIPVPEAIFPKVWFPILRKQVFAGRRSVLREGFRLDANREPLDGQRTTPAEQHVTQQRPLK
jgi:hypothetical protein